MSTNKHYAPVATLFITAEYVEHFGQLRVYYYSISQGLLWYFWLSLNRKHLTGEKTGYPSFSFKSWYVAMEIMTKERLSQRGRLWLDSYEIPTHK